MSNSHSNGKHTTSLWSICFISLLIVICKNCWTLSGLINDAYHTQGISSFIPYFLQQTPNNKLIHRRLSLKMNRNINNVQSTKLNTLVPLLRNNTDTIIFLKTHKTASSSMTNLLHTFAVRHNKSCPIFDNKFSGQQFNFNNKKDREIVSNSKTLNGEKKLDLWVNHAIFDEYLYELIPSSKHQILTTIRNPNQRFLSAWKYYHAQSKYKMNITQFIDQYSHKNAFQGNIPTEIEINCLCKEIIPKYADPDYDATKNNNWDRIKFGDFLVLIAERFDESLLLLKYAYNLEWKDLFYKKMTKKSASLTNYQLKRDKIKLTKEQDMKLKLLQDCDWKLYHIAMKVFDQRLYQIYGNNQTLLQQDIDILRKTQREERHKCLLHPSRLSAEQDRICNSHAHDNKFWNKWAKEI